MTSHYLDLRLRPDPETAPHQIMSALYGRLHSFLSRAGSEPSETGSGIPQSTTTRGEIGVSFPEHDDAAPTLGTVLRLHGSKAMLEVARESTWLIGMRDYVIIGEVDPVPEGCLHRVVSRVQVKSNSERLQRRAMKRHGYTEEEAKARFPKAAERRSTLPFVTIGSKSTGQPSLRLIIRHGALVTQASDGPFGSYGLSATGTIPWF